MKKVFTILTVCLLVLVTAATVYAKSVEIVSSSTSVTTSSNTCGGSITLTDGTVYSFVGTYTVDKADNAGGNSVFECSGQLTTDAPKSALQATAGFSRGCWNGETFVRTAKWGYNITPSGDAKFQCHVNPSQ